MQLTITSLGRYKVTRLLDDHRAVQLLYSAYDPEQDREVAIKVWFKGSPEGPSGVTDQAKYIRRFVAECEAATRIEHPRVAHMYEGGTASGIFPGHDPEKREFRYCVREMVEGTSLRSLLDAGRRPTVAEAMAIATELLETIQHLHLRGHFNLALKPENVFVTTNGGIKVTDLLTIPRDGTGAGTLFVAPSAIDRPFYISPEQVEMKTLDHRSDVYAAAAVLFELLTGAPPFSAQGVWALAKKIRDEQPPLPSAINSGIAPALDSVILKALSKDPEQRYSSAAEFSAALRDTAESYAVTKRI